MKKYIVGPKMKENGLFAGNKFPRDVIKICEVMGYKPVFVREIYSKKRPWQLLEDYFHLLKIKSNSVVIYIDQVAPRISRKLVYSVLQRKNVKVIPLLEDMDIIRNNSISKKQQKRMLNCLNKSAIIISQNKKMSDYLKEKGISTEIVELNLLDFLTTKFKSNHHFPLNTWTICYGGSLSFSQSGFLRNIELRSSDKVKYYIYGKGDISNDVSKPLFYKGVFSAEECINKLKGDWGLVWNGQSSNNTNSQDSFSVYYDYVCPHKLSMYLLCGMPVIVSSKSAVANFVKKINVEF
ncbi:conserved hypothetical protein [Lactobacillus acetotolerans]|uniref:Glycosyltransferase n=1 Tax=Lactobacillus acetotolerans TaxID=1600 RepID=A0A0D6A0S7_9LACO|nr:beta-1,6-galactofuranosyltransferase [Lactobacillus acetotolerans]BAQ56422.1 conserved hypothetical protein [Lactobacillus acetotolerans]